MSVSGIFYEISKMQSELVEQLTSDVAEIGAHFTKVRKRHFTQIDGFIHGERERYIETTSECAIVSNITDSDVLHFLLKYSKGEKIYGQQEDSCTYVFSVPAESMESDTDVFVIKF